MLGPTPEDLVIVSNREPYVHTYDDGEITVEQPSGGVTAALTDVAADLDGTWVAWGSGEADFDPAVVDGRGTVTDDGVAAGYDLRRVRLDEDAVAQYYYGYANQALWPLCHVETEHLRFDRDHWERYRAVNEQFAEAVAEVATDAVWIHDYHFGLLPEALRDATDASLRLVHFWHIPWPPADVFALCPQRRALLRGLLHDDAVGFHTDRFRDHFLDSVAAFVPEATVEGTSVHVDGRTVETFAVPVGVDAADVSRTLATHDVQPSTRRRHGIDTDTTLAVGVDRVDYTKGIVERLDALDRALATTPRLEGSLTYLQVASQSRSQIPAYSNYQQAVTDRVDEINDRYGTDEWRPVVYTEATLSRAEIFRTFADADCCLVSSRRDGLNLVAEEFVAASQDDPGELLLSEFTGVADLFGDDATLINPFDTAGFADAIVAAVDRPEAARRRQTDALVSSLREHSLQRWVDRQLGLFSAGR